MSTTAHGKQQARKHADSLSEEHLQLRIILIAQALLRDIQPITVLVVALFGDRIDLRLPVVRRDLPVQQAELVQLLDGHGAHGLVGVREALVGVGRVGLFVEPSRTVRVVLSRAYRDVPQG